MKFYVDFYNSVFQILRMASLRPVLQIGLFFLLGVSLGTVFHLNSGAYFFF